MISRSAGIAAPIELEEDATDARRYPYGATQKKTVVPLTNSFRNGLLDRSGQGKIRSALRTDTPEHRPFSASADVTCARNIASQVAFGGANRSAQVLDCGVDGRQVGRFSCHLSLDETHASDTARAVQDGPGRCTERASR